MNYLWKVSAVAHLFYMFAARRRFRSWRFLEIFGIKSQRVFFNMSLSDKS